MADLSRAQMLADSITRPGEFPDPYDIAAAADQLRRLDRTATDLWGESSVLRALLRQAASVLDTIADDDQEDGGAALRALLEQIGAALDPSSRDCQQMVMVEVSRQAGTAPVAQQARWYMVTKDGAATLCVDRADAEQNARDADIAWPRNAPHRAVQLVEVAGQEGGT
jgi:hypothetical protein